MRQLGSKIAAPVQHSIVARAPSPIACASSARHFWIRSLTGPDRVLAWLPGTRASPNVLYRRLPRRTCHLSAYGQGHVFDRIAGWSVCRVPARIEFQRQNSAFHRGPDTIARTLVLMHAIAAGSF